jgi:hypothetical protein
MSGCLPGPGQQHMTGDSELQDDGESHVLVAVRSSNYLSLT